MPMQSAKSGLASILNDAAKKVFEANKAKVEVPQDFGELPIGVSGIARLVRCGFKRVDQVKPGDKSGAKVGDYWFNAMGVVVEPTWFTDDTGNRHRVAGKQTRIIEAVFDTPKKSEAGRSTQAEHLDWIMKQLKYLLGGTLESFTVNDLESVCEILTKQKPYFAFSITSGKPSPQYPKPRGFHNWQGRVDDFNPNNVPAQSSSSGNTKPMVNDTTTAGKPSTNGTHAVNTSQPANDVVRRNTVMPPTPSQEESTDHPFDEFGDMDSLATKANKGDEAAMAQLTEFAKNAGVPEEDVENAKNWNEVVMLIKDQQTDGAAVDSGEGDEGGESQEEVDPTPKLDTVYKYWDKKKKKTVDVLCIKVNVNKSICSLKNQSTNEIYPNVPFEEVLPPE